MANAGEFDRPVGFEREGITGRNALNEPVDGFALIGRAYAKRIDVRDTEKVAAGFEGRALMARFRVRSTSLTRSLTPADRLIESGVWDGGGVLQSGVIWTIKGVKDAAGPRRDVIEVTAVTAHEG
ncbi:MAG TPA: hypothetical protein DIT40_05985 [Alphaproteobacteria bacterium]|nr:hypothetical protein [Alphaproteobacteria bacterium]